jgi:hypothetical protein
MEARFYYILCACYIYIIGFIFHFLHRPFGCVSQVTDRPWITHRAAASIFPKLLLPARCGAVADGQVMAVVGLASPGFNYLLDTMPEPWW